MTGREVLTNVVSTLERINPEDRFCPFCEALLAIIRPHLSPEPQTAEPSILEE